MCPLALYPKNSIVLYFRSVICQFLSPTEINSLRSQARNHATLSYLGVQFNTYFIFSFSLDRDYSTTSIVHHIHQMCNSAPGWVTVFTLFIHMFLTSWPGMQHNIHICLYFTPHLPRCTIHKLPFLTRYATQHLAQVLHPISIFIN